MGHILLVEDDESLNRGISFKLKKEGHKVFSCSGEKEAKRAFKSETFDLVICDIGLEDGNGIDFCKEIRGISNISFIFLTALDQEIDIVMGYEAGADDYITKPFSLAVLISKVNAVFRRMDQHTADKLESQGVCFLKGEMKILVEGEEKALSKNEIRLLSMLMEHPKQILSKVQLLEALWDQDGEFVDDNTVAVNIRRLREKIEPEPSKPIYIKNVRGLGYLWDKECRKA